LAQKAHNGIKTGERKTTKIFSEEGLLNECRIKTMAEELSELQINCTMTKKNIKFEHKKKASN
jgi:hypothetical protein